MKRVVSGALGLAFALATVPAWAQAQDEKKKEGEQKEISLSGAITKETVKRKAKDGTEKDVNVYTLTDKEGKKTVVQAPKGKKTDQAKPVNLDEYVGKTVEIKGMAAETIRKGKSGTETKVLAFSKIDSVTVAEEKKEEKKEEKQGNP